MRLAIADPPYLGRALIRTGDVRVRVGSLFSGYAGLDLAVEQVLGATPAWFVEFDKHPSTILAQRFPGVPNYGDITRVDWSAVEPVDVLTGGYPCQPFSHAGNRKGTNDERHLWPYVKTALRLLRPRLAVFENVAGHLSLGFDTVLADLAEIGWDAEWVVVQAAHAGACHRRERVFIVAAPRDSARRWQWAAFADGSGQRGTAGQARSASNDAAPHAGRGQLAWPAVGADRLPEPAERGDGPVTLLSTPTTMDHLEPRTGEALDYVLRRGEPDGALLPTPVTNDMGAGKTVEGWDAWTDAMRAKHGNGNGHGKSLAIEAQRLLPTPRAQDGPKGGPGQRNGRGEPDSLPGVLPLLAHDIADGVLADFGPYAPAIARWEAVLGRPVPSPTEPGKDGRPRLSPAFVEWMMGLPDGWVTDTGIPRNAQLKALGNGVVPQQAALALSILLPRLEQP